MTFDPKVAMNVIKSRIEKGEPFSLDNIHKEILKKNGIMRIQPDVTVKDYLKQLDEKGVIKYNPYNDTYLVFDGRLESILGY